MRSLHPEDQYRRSIVLMDTAISASAFTPEPRQRDFKITETIKGIMATGESIRHTSRGALIVLEGLDRSGKSSQAARLAENLRQRGNDVKSLRFPDRSTPIGGMIDAYLKGHAQQEDHVIHLLFSSNRWEAAEQIRTAIASGTTVIVDRYYYSGIVYSAAKDNPNLTLAWAREPEVGLPRPDICLFLDISPGVAAKRGGFGLEKYENDRTQSRVREVFYKILIMPDKEDFCVIDADKPVPEVERSVLDTVLDRMRRVEITNAPLRSVLPWSQELPANGGL